MFWQTSARCPDFIHKITKDSLWIHSEKNPFWVFEEMKKRVETNKEELGEKERNNRNDYDNKEGIACVELLKSCARRKDLVKGTSIHDDILEKGLLVKFPYLGSTLVNMYAKCGALAT